MTDRTNGERHVWAMTWFGTRRAALRVLAGSVLAGSVAATGLALPAVASVETGWRFCKKCRVLWFPNGSDKGACAAGGGHSLKGSKHYALKRNEAPGPNEEGTWRYCTDCNEVYYGGASAGPGACAATGSSHVTLLSDVYVFEYNVAPEETEQGGWRYCPKCLALFRPKKSNRGVCPAGGKHKIYAGYTYNLDLEP